MIRECFKNRLLDYICAEGLEINTHKKPPVFRCPSGTHADNSPSCLIYIDRVWCPACGFQGDIYDVAGVISGRTEFVKIKDVIRDRLSIPKAPFVKIKQDVKRKKMDVKPVKLSLSDSRKHYTWSNFRKLSHMMGDRPGTPVDAWPYFDKRGFVVMVDVRYENEKGKNVISVWFNGKTIQASNPPHCMYNRNLVETMATALVVIVEGCKAAKALQDAIPSWVAVTWNGGTNRLEKTDWSCLNGRSVAIFPDDDKPGMDAAKRLQKTLPHAKIISPITEYRKKMETGADVYDYLDKGWCTPKRLEKYILDEYTGVEL